MQTVEKPNFFVVPQLAQTVFDGKRANFFTFFSAALDDIFCYLLVLICWKKCPL